MALNSSTHSKQSFVFCFFCHRQTEEQDDKLVAWTQRAGPGRYFRWTRCEYCNKQYRQKYNTYLKAFTDPDTQWSIR